MEHEENELAFKPSPIGIRLQERLDELGISHSAANDAARSYARSLKRNLGQTYVRDLCIGRIQSPSFEKLDIVSAVFGLSPTFLASGNGVRLQERNSTEGYVERHIKFSTKSEPDDISYPTTRRMKIHASAAAGEGMEIMPDFVGWTDCPPDLVPIEEAFAVQ